MDIKSRRTYNSRTTRIGFREFCTEFHLSNIHYKNKLKLGDGDDTYLRNCDWTLHWSEERQGWTFEYNNFIPLVPKYADEWFEFRDVFKNKDQKVKYRAVANHIEGTLINNRVVYTNAFGLGYDLIISPTKCGMQKLVRIREGYRPNIKVDFDFEVILPDDVYIDFDKKNNAKTHIKQLRYWDNNGNSGKLKYRFYTANSKTYLRKTITKAVLDSTSGDLYCDTTTSYYAGTADARLGTTTTRTWANQRALTTADSFYTNLTEDNFCYALGTGPTYSQYQLSAYTINTSGIPEGVTINSASFNVYANTKTWDSATVNQFDYCLVSATTASAGTIVAADLGNVSYTRVSDSDINMDTFYAAPGYRSWTFNTVGISNLSTTGYTTVAVRGVPMLSDDTAPNGNTGGRAYYADSAGTTYDPYISVTYTLTPTPGLTLVGRKIRLRGGSSATTFLEGNDAGIYYLTEKAVTYTTNYTTDSDQLDLYIRGTGTWTLTLATASATTGRVIKVKNAGTGVITIDPEGSTLIEGGATWLVNAGEFYECYFNGVGWEIR